MPAPRRTYKALIRLYPREFRADYGDDLAQLFDDLVAERGARAAIARTALDLVVTLPRYRLETIMNERHTANTITIAAGLAALAGVASVLVGIYPGALLIIVAIALAVAQRSAVARALRAPDAERRRRRLRIAAVLGVVFIASFITYLLVIGETWTTRETVLAVIGNAALIGTIGFLAAGLLTPKTSGSH